MAFKEERIAYQTIVVIELKRILRIWSQTILPPAITSILYFFIFGQIIGERVGTINGYKYIQFIAPGLIMMNIITSSYSSAVSAFFGAKFQYSIEELLVSPVSNITILLGYMSSGVLRGILVGIIVTLIALFFTHLHVHSIISILIAALLSACIFALAGLINAIYAKNFEGISIIPTFVLTPLTYLGGVFYPITLLPKFWQYVSYVNPVSYIIDNFRYGFLGIKDSYLTLSYFLMLSFIIILFSISYYLMEKGVGLRE
ncbi:ABC transporter permease [Coxiella burnetii]|uniref:ABC transporter permease n=1 Tax=Coxiella burnetii TaxID=777 RepID=UPI00039B73D3|nr:ABC transporter permease [Coxiella burnetii]AML49228.1 ABC transporter permease [Coxiella burnetii]ATN69142.1 ABC transporter permease [Coxiella burnetii]ATN72971.1 ABC transporter permease [Coxiella burnetii]AZV75839.1 ABC transporter permease [Coxiella burnetii]KJY15239.1 ABC transporter permease [Coxiella burnetii]